MTVSTTKASDVFPGNGVATGFSCEWRIFDDTDVLVSLVDQVTGADTPLVLNTDYTISGAGDQAGFTVATMAPVASGTNLYVRRALAYEQPTDFTNQGAFFPTMHEDAMDRLEMQIQQLAASTDLSLKMPGGITPTPSPHLPPPSPLSPLVWNADGTALENGSTSLTGDMLLRPDLASTAMGKGASLVGIKRTDVSNAIASALSNWLDAEPINVVRDYGFDNTGATTNDASLATMLASLQLNVDGRGRRIVFKAGTYKFGTSMDFTAYAAGLVHNIYLEGEGCSNTVLDFSAAPAGTDGVTFDAGAHFGVKNLTISGAMRHGLVIGRGTTVGGTSYCNFYIIENVRVQGCGGNGIQSQNSYLGSYRDVWTKNNGGSGFVLAGFHTALSVERVESSDNALAGFSVNGVCYSHFTACGADVNMTQGWALSNMQGVTITSCGAESNGRDGWFFFSSDTSATGLTVQQTNIRGVVLEGCYGLSNSTSSPGTYATFVGATSANGRSININVKGGVAHPAQTTDSAFVLQGVLGKITVHKDAFDDSSFIAADQATGDTSVNDMSIIGRRCLLQAASSQSIPTGADTLINTWNTTPNANDLGATVSASQITIPRGVNKVVVSAGMAWSAASGGSYRLMKIFKNAAGFAGQGQQTTGVASFGLCSARSAVVSVAAGDTFELHVQHDAGVAASTIGTNNSMWFCVEAVG